MPEETPDDNGWIDDEDGDEEWEDCEKCGGEGFVNYYDCPELWGEDCPSEVDHLEDCPECHGHGGFRVKRSDSE